MDLKQYITDINQQYRTGLAREHSYRPALKNLLENLMPSMVVTNEPAHFECGAPDYIIMREKDHLPVFFVEAKDIGDNDLDGRNLKGHKEQFDRYRQALDYIIFTDYLDFHLYEHGEFVDSVRIAQVKGDKIVAISEAQDKFLGMINHLAGVAIQKITSASRLAKLMAAKARLLARVIEQAVVSDEDKANDGNGNADSLFQLPQDKAFQSGLREQMETFKRVLLHDITPASFADVYAQTIVYGLFAARLNDKTPEDFSRHEALSLIPKTSPFLRNLFQQVVGLDPDPRIEWIIDDLVTAFGATDMRKVLTSYNKDTQREDPMMHFYEDFLAAYNPALRKARGVWYTPQPVVSFIVRAIDEILQRDFGLADGLADYSKIPHTIALEQSQDKRTADRKKHVTQDVFRVQILDPAMGTGTFLHEIIRQIKDKFIGNEGIWKDYVRSYLLPRIYGFEVMMAPYTIAHMKLFLQLKDDVGLSETDFPGLNLLLTNSLEEANKDIDTLFSVWLSNEAKRASIIKRDCPVMVMVGNPPYSISSQNNGNWITNLIADYKKNLNEKNIQPLSDDYIKFIRLAQYYVEKNGEGIVGIISNNSFLDGIIFRQMRRRLLEAFDNIYIINLHGNSKKRETAIDGSKDENVFDIQQGVSINIFVKTGRKAKNSLGHVFYHDIYGLRNYKYETLKSLLFVETPWTNINLEDPYYFFVPKDFSARDDYEKGFKLDQLFTYNVCGFVTSKDKVNVKSTKEEAKILIQDCRNLSIEAFREKYNTGNDTRDWSVERAMADVKENEAIVAPYLYRPFDTKYIVHTGKTNGLVAWPRGRSLDVLLHPQNLGLLVCKQQSSFDFQHVFIVKEAFADKCTNSSQTKEATYVFPLYIKSNKSNPIFEEGDNIIPNFNIEIVEQIEQSLGEKVVSEELFDYIYAVLHSPSYRERYKEFLKIDFPRIPFPATATQYHSLKEKGAELRRLHLMEGLPSLTGVTMPVAGSLRVDCYRWQDGRVYINSEQYFEGVPQSAWQFYIGGYQPAQKWLKDRKGMTLNFEDVKHYEQIIYVLMQTERLMNEIDKIVT